MSGQRQQPLPNVIGVGFPKAGTTFISNVLADHPQVCFSTAKETNFFSKTYHLGLAYYAGYFSHFNQANHRVVAEWSNSYIYDLNALEKIRQDLGPEIKLLVCIRPPEETVLSFVNYMIMNYRLDHRIRVSEVIENNLNGIMDRVRFDIFLDRMLGMFPARSVYICHYKEMKRDRNLFFNNLFDFIGIDFLDNTELVNIFPANLSQPFRYRKVHGLLFYYLKLFHGEKGARKILTAYPPEKPLLIRILQKWNTRRRELSASDREVLRDRLSSTNEALQSIISDWRTASK